MTWNLWSRFGPWEARMAAIIQETGNTRPDLLLLQEAWEDNGQCQASIIADSLGFATALGLAQHRPGGHSRNAICSRWPLRETEEIPLPTSPDAEPSNYLLMAVVEAPYGPHLVATTHLEWRYDASLQRQAQLTAACSAITARQIDRNLRLPTLFGGDLNADCGSDEIRRLTGQSEPYVGGLVFTDAWAATNTEHGHTVSQANPHAIDAHFPGRRVDYVLTGWPRPKPTLNPRRAWLAGMTNDKGVTPSDHYAIVVDLDDRSPYDAEDDRE